MRDHKRPLYFVYIPGQGVKIDDMLLIWNIYERFFKTVIIRSKVGIDMFHM